MKKIVSIIVNSPYFDFSGSNSAVANYLKCVAEEFESSGIEVRLLPQSKKNSTDSVLNRSKVEFIKNIFSVFPSFYNTLSLLKYLKHQKIIEQCIVQESAGSNIIIEFLTYGSQIVDKLKTIDRKYILIFDAPIGIQYLEMYKAKSFIHRKLVNAEMRSLEKADVIVCYSLAVKRYLEALKLKTTIIVIPCIAWKQPVIKKEESSNIRIGFIGSFLNWHKVELLVKAFEKIASKYPFTELILVGYGEEWNNIKSIVNKSSYAGRITMTGFVSESELERIKSEMTIGVMPGSNWYGSPLKLFEYAESGIPIIAPTTPTVSEYFRDRENALLINPDNELESLVECLGEMIADKNLRKRLGENGLKMMQNDLSEEKVMSKFVQLIQNII